MPSAAAISTWLRPTASAERMTSFWYCVRFATALDVVFREATKSVSFAAASAGAVHASSAAWLILIASA